MRAPAPPRLGSFFGERTADLRAMGWVIHKGFITSDNRAIGSIIKAGNKWLVEILWSGPTGDIKFDSDSIAAALAFIKGVEKTFEAITGSEAP